MPGGDRTGPMGQGPMTGGGRGYCTGGNFAGAGYGGRGFYGGGGRGFGFGGGRGYRNRFYATGLTGWQRAGYGAFQPYGMPVNREQEVASLRDQVQYHEGILAEIKNRLDELANQADGDT